ncbi:MAG: hypothetical protein LUC90_06945 [Lachnospiraceae bacterium]|nr:hypothetical protein [Lachnospiraceae bacterium]
MLSEAFIILRQNTLGQTGSGLFYLSLFLLLMVFAKREERYKFVYPVYMTFFAFVWYPVYAYVINPVFTQFGHRMVNAIPIAVIIALVVSYCCSRLHGKEVLLAVAGVLLLMYFNSDYDYEDYLKDFYEVENIYGLPQDVVDVCDLLLSEDEDPFIIATDGDWVYFRQYSSKIKLLYGNNLNGTMDEATPIPADYKDLAATLESTEFINLDYVGEKANQYDVEYIVINVTTHVEPYMAEGIYYSLYATIGDYQIYKSNSL